MVIVRPEEKGENKINQYLLIPLYTDQSFSLIFVATISALLVKT